MNQAFNKIRTAAGGMARRLKVEAKGSSVAVLAGGTLGAGSGYLNSSRNDTGPQMHARAAMHALVGAGAGLAAGVGARISPDAGKAVFGMGKAAFAKASAYAKKGSNYAKGVTKPKVVQQASGPVHDFVNGQINKIADQITGVGLPQRLMLPAPSGPMARPMGPIVTRGGFGSTVRSGGGSRLTATIDRRHLPSPNGPGLGFGGSSSNPRQAGIFSRMGYGG